MLSVQYFTVFLITEIIFAIAANSVDFDKKRPFLKYYETISYDNNALHQHHQRLKRATNEEERLIPLELFAYQRKFELILRRDAGIFADDFEVVSGTRSVPTDISFIYNGELRNENGSFCHGSIINGHFEGFIRTQNGTFYVEYEKTHSNGTVDTFMYHESDIDYSLMKDAESYELTLKKYQLLEQMSLKVKGESPTRKKRSMELSRTTCLLYLKADYFFFSRFKSVEKVISQISSYLVSVNSIYEYVNFNGIKHINFKVKLLNVIQEKDPSSPMNSAYIGPEKLLMLHSQSNWNSYCLSYMLTNRDYNGVLGLAWNGNSGNEFGICSKFAKYDKVPDTDVTLNTGIVTIQKYGQYLPARLIHITLAHEFGHSLGSPHDESPNCANFISNNNDNGNFLMFPYAMDGNQYNNDKFSTCSIHYISNILQVKMDICFVESGRPTCGNQIVEEGEQCDVGSRSNDSCCYGAKLGDPLQCTLRPGKQCSPSQGLCCNHACTHKSSEERCQEEAECTYETYCTGMSPKCPKPPAKNNYTLCNFGSRICLNGMCRQSICVKYGLEQCDCDGNDLYEKCQLCCQVPGNPYSCRSTKSAELHPIFNNTPIYLPPGSPCGHRQGYCDKLFICRYVDADGPIARLKNSFLHLIESEDVAAWMKARWWAILLIILTLAALMAGTVFLFGRTVDSEKDTGVNKSSLKKQSQRNRTVYYEEDITTSAYLQYETRL
ncbi:disintegrin and metalloproteinase domain-containing protein 10-like [Pelobates fuscus]|uniref:disintegrin and metalloproteinase domain-containing protein 10-like n=1 Tax=Pelobates fuscus TaxID=191477 RepID=UPI002FE44E9C